MKKILLTFAGMLVALVATSTFAADASPAAGTGASFKGPLGLQLWSLRDEFKKDVPAAMDKVHTLGFRLVELAGLYGKTPEEIKALLAARGLKAVAGHVAYDRLRTDPEGVAKEAKALGLEYIGTAWISHNGAFKESDVHEAAKVFNHAGELLAQQGIKLYCHNHGYEFVPYGDGTLFDLLMSETKPEFLSFEMDVTWVVFPGQDPTKLLQKYAGRWSLMHLKDLKRGVATGALTGKTDVKNDVVIGTGQTDWPSVLKAAQKVGIKYYFIEDESPSALEQIPQSMKFLEQVKF